jgi:quinol monooxygenase YgiN
MDLGNYKKGENLMSNNNITVIAELRAREGIEQKVSEELKALIAPSRSEPGCITYNLHQAADNKSLFMVYECWKSKKDFDEHLQKPYLKALLEKADDLLAEQVKLTLWKLVV